ncbi:hypothetical protein [Microbacterium sp. P03]|uniref:hypothetical protein n=1 Tax=Microbacterium sp. P03 TaxID=3366946 RepID=UPI00374715BE
MTRAGWYVHHHGHGHLTRFLAVRPHLDAHVTVFSSLEQPADLPDGTEWVVLPRDDDPRFDAAGIPHDPLADDPTAGGALHWAPRGHPGHRRRLTTIADECERDPFDVFVVDVSVEVTVWVRLLGVPTVVFTQPGERTDAPHRLAYSVADRIIAPWARGTTPSAALEVVGEKVSWVGGISRFDGRARSQHPLARHVLVLGQVAGTDVLHRAATDAAAHGWTMTVAGASSSSWQADPWDALCASEVVISAAGQNSVADLAAAEARALVIASPRPFDEQGATARVLDDAGLAVVADSWPSADGLPALLDRARSLSPAWDRWGVGGAAARAAGEILGAAR